MKHQEHILAMPVTSLPDMKDGEVWVSAELKSKDVVIMQRALLEKNTTFRQYIPYAMIKCGEKYGVYRRTSEGNESRLHGLVSMGFGGHIDLSDAVLEDNVLNIKKTIADAARRELEEELVLGEDNSILSITQYDEMIASSSSFVDAVHLGVVMVIEVENESVRSGESQIDWLGFKTLEEINAFPEKESWTGIILNRLI